MHGMLDGNYRFIEDGEIKHRIWDRFDEFLIIFLPQQTPIKGPIHNYDPHNFDDMYADEYGGYGTGMNTGNFRGNSGGAGNGNGGNTAGRFGNDRGQLDEFTLKIESYFKFPSRFGWKPKLQ